ncbi:MAG: CPBP family intramembrane glutamic endopeptidase [Chlamydiota bacterium]
MVFAIYILVNLVVAPVIIQMILSLFWGISLKEAYYRPELLGWILAFSLLLSAVSVGCYCFTGRRQVIVAKIWEVLPRKKWLVPSKMDIGMGIIGGLISFPLVVFITNAIMLLLQKLYGEVDLEQVAVRYVKQLLDTPWILGLNAALIVVVVPIMEELLFRGFLQTILRRYYSRRKAILIAAILFAAFHFSTQQGVLNFQLIPALLVLGWFLGYVYEKQQNLWAPISLHAIFNFANIMALFLVHK